MGAMATVAAILHRDRTGEGQHIEQSQLDAVGSFVAPAYLEYTVTGNDVSARDLQNRTDAPHGSFRCRGEDAWCVVAIESDDQWQRLVGVIGLPDEFSSESLDSEEARRAARPAIDAHVTAWTRQHTPHQVMTLLQSAGVPAAIVQDAEDLARDAHLWSRGFFELVADPLVGPMRYPGAVVHLDHTPASVGEAPEFGEANDYILRDLLGIDESSIERLRADGVLD